MKISMCLVLYLGSEEKLPILPIDPDNRAFNTRELDESEMEVLLHFSMDLSRVLNSKEAAVIQSNLHNQ